MAAIQSVVLFWEVQDYDDVLAQLQKALADFKAADARISQFRNSYQGDGARHSATSGSRSGRSSFPLSASHTVELAVADVVSVFSLRAASPPSNDDVVMRAMRDDLARSMQQLQLDTQPKPYVVSYMVRETTTKATSATFGSLVSSSEHRARMLAVVVRPRHYTLETRDTAPSSAVQLCSCT